MFCKSAKISGMGFSELVGLWVLYLNIADKSKGMRKTVFAFREFTLALPRRWQASLSQANRPQARFWLTEPGSRPMEAREQGQ